MSELSMARSSNVCNANLFVSMSVALHRVIRASAVGKKVGKLCIHHNNLEILEVRTDTHIALYNKCHYGKHIHIAISCINLSNKNVSLVMEDIYRFPAAQQKH